MEKQINELDKKIIAKTQELALKNGLFNLEMKDIAKEVGISRSTLYRHFDSKLDIAFLISESFILEFSNPKVTYVENSKGFEKFKLTIHSIIDLMLNNLDKLAFLSELDTLYNVKSPITDNAKEYEAFMGTYSSSLFSTYEEGIKDGSIKKEYAGNSVARTILNTSYAMTQRIGLRESIYIREHQMGQEMIYQAINLQLAAIKAN